MSIVRAVATVLSLVGLSALTPDGGARAASPRRLTLAYTAELRGNILPCTCPRDPFGGMDRRIGFVDSLRSAGEALVVLDAGGLFPAPETTHMLSEAARESLQCLVSDGASSTGYDAIAGSAAPPHPRCGAPLPWLPPATARAIVRAGSRVVLASVAESLDPREARRAIKDAGRRDLLVLLVDGDLSFATYSARLLGADVAIVARGAWFPEPIHKDGVLFLGPGRDGKYVGLLTLELGSGAPRVVRARLRPMDGLVAAPDPWTERVAAFVMAVDRENPGALYPSE